MSKGIFYTKLSEDLVPFDLYNLLRKGLQPYDSHSGKPISCPQTLHLYFKVSSKIRRLDNKIKSFTIDPTELKEAEKFLSQDGFILVPEKESIIDRLDFLTNEKVISDEYFKQLRQKDSKYRITLKEIVILWGYRSKLIEKQNKFIKQRSRIVDDDPELISWRHLVEIKSTEQKKKFSEELENAYFEQDEVDKLLEKTPSSRSVEPSSKSRKRETKSPVTENQDYSFIFEGVVWSVTYGGKTCQLKNNERIKYIAYLLDNPDHSFRSYELWGIVKGETVTPPPKELTKEDEDGYRGILIKQHQEIQEAHQQNKPSHDIEKLEDDYESTKKFLEKEYGVIISKNGNSIKIEFKGGPQYKKDAHYDAVKKQIKEAIKQIEKKLPELAKHLNKNIDGFSYRPPTNSPEWRVIF